MTETNHLSTLTHADPATVKAFAEALLPELGDVNVRRNRTGLVMLPATDSVRGTVFHLGEVLVTEALVELPGGAQGYAACTGRDAEQAIACALLDAAIRTDAFADRVRAFVEAQAAANAAADEALLRNVNATRVEMETF